MQNVEAFTGFQYNFCVGSRNDLLHITHSFLSFQYNFCVGSSFALCKKH